MKEVEYIDDLSEAEKERGIQFDYLRGEMNRVIRELNEKIDDLEDEITDLKSRCRHLERESL